MMSTPTMQHFNRNTTNTSTLSQESTPDIEESHHGPLRSSPILTIRGLLLQVRPCIWLSHRLDHLLCTQCAITTTHGIFYLLSINWTSNIPARALCQGNQARHHRRKEQGIRAASPRSRRHEDLRRRTHKLQTDSRRRKLASRSTM
jgi:hypothetical protein